MDGLRDKLRKIVSTMLSEPFDRVDVNVTKKTEEDSNLEFFIVNPSERTVRACNSGELPPKVLKALLSDEDISKLLPTKGSSRTPSGMYMGGGK